MKKEDKMKIATIAIGASIGIAFLILTFYLNRTVRMSVKNIGSAITKTQVSIKNAKMSIFTGNGEINGLVIGNPDGFKTPAAITMEHIEFHVDTTSLFSRNIVVNKILVDGIEITYEISEDVSNIDVIMDNIESLVEDKTDDEKTEVIENVPTTEPKKDKPVAAITNKWIFIKDITFINGRIKIINNILQGKSTTLPLPSINRKDIGNEATKLSTIIKSKALRIKRGERMRSFRVQKMAATLFRVISDTVMSTIETSKILDKEDYGKYKNQGDVSFQHD
ncbi:MAG: hypothetical protein ACUZ8O_01970 [Candidatus Anammoxibacter sp.]